MVATLIWAFLSINAYSQQQLELIDSISVKAVKSTRIDPLGNFYVVKKDNSILLIKKDGTIFTHNEKSLGDVYNLDVSNPMRILIFYAEAGTIMFLDNTLTEMGKVPLSNFNIYGTNAVAGISKLGGFWIYDPIGQSLSRYAIDGTKYSGTQLNNSIGSFKPLQLIEKNNIVYISTLQSGLYTFDINGTYISRFNAALNIGFNFQATNQHLIWAGDEELNLLNLKSLEENKVPLPQDLQTNKALKTLHCTDEQCITFGKSKLLVFKIK